MNVEQLIARLQEMPGYYPVHLPPVSDAGGKPDPGTYGELLSEVIHDSGEVRLR